jgi:hypothetical protein
MRFSGLRKPIQNDSIDNYEGILVSLAQAKRHNAVIAEYERRRSAEAARNRGMEASSAAKAVSDAGPIEEASGEDNIIRTSRVK